MAEANQARQDCHHSGVSEAQCRDVETIFTIGWSGDLVESHHVRGGRASALSASHKRRLAYSPEGVPVFRADPAPDSEVLGVADHRFGAQRPPLFEVLLDTRGWRVGDSGGSVSYDCLNSDRRLIHWSLNSLRELP
jgi:hypothetical protein